MITFTVMAMQKVCKLSTLPTRETRWSQRKLLEIHMSPEEKSVLRSTWSHAMQQLFPQSSLLPIIGVVNSVDFLEEARYHKRDSKTIASSRDKWSSSRTDFPLFGFLQNTTFSFTDHLPKWLSSFYGILSVRRTKSRTCETMFLVVSIWIWAQPLLGTKILILRMSPCVESPRRRNSSRWKNGWNRAATTKISSFRLANGETTLIKSWTRKTVKRNRNDPHTKSRSEFGFKFWRRLIWRPTNPV